MSADDMKALLTARGIPVCRLPDRRGVRVDAHGGGACRLTFHPARPVVVPKGEPWGADAAAEGLVERVTEALAGASIARTGTGRQTVLLVTVGNEEALEGATT